MSGARNNHAQAAGAHMRNEKRDIRAIDVLIFMIYPGFTPDSVLNAAKT